MRRPKAGRHVDPHSPRGYYVDFTALADPRGPVDRHGIPVTRPGAAREAHSPLDVARYGLGNLEIYLSNGSAWRRDRFEKAARLLIDAIEVVPSSFGGWAMPPAPPPYGVLLPSGHLSAGAQGECLSLVVRAWVLLGTGGAEEAARTAAAAMVAPVADGGLLREIGERTGDAGIDSLAFLEEHPIPERPVMDLSGHVRGLLGVHDYWAASGEPSHGSLRARLLNGLRFVLDRYDLGYWTRDNLDADAPSVSTVSSLGEHVLHLKALAGVSGDDVFHSTARRWRAYLGSPLSRARALAARTALRLGVGGGQT